jgi:hypothetical protein
VITAYPALLGALPPPIGGGGEVDEDDFDNDKDNNKTKEVELVAADDNVIIFCNIRRWPNACVQRCLAYCIACTLLPLSHVR